MVIKLPETRKVLFEKYNGETAAEELFYSLLDGCEKTTRIEKYTNERFLGYKKESEFIFGLYDYSENDKTSSITHHFQMNSKIYLEFSKILTDYFIVCKFIKEQVKKHVLFNNYDVSVFHEDSWSSFK